jgi:hypothetical protein
MRPPVLSQITKYVDHLEDYLASDESPERDLPIVMSHLYPVCTHPIILYNTEQMTRTAVLAAFVARAHQPDVAEVWDYSQANLAILAEHGIVGRHVPVGTTVGRAQEMREDISGQRQTYDIGFSGAISQRRAAVLLALQEAGLRVRNVPIFGRARDRALAQSLCMLNIHFADDYRVFESVRCDPWLSVGVPIVSETSLDDDPRCINVPYSELVSATVQLVQRLKEEREAMTAGVAAAST